MSDNVIVIGAGGHAKVIADIVLKSDDVLIGFLDDKVQGLALGYPVRGRLADYNTFAKNAEFVIGIGDNETRKCISESIKVQWYTAAHPRAVIANGVIIGEGTVIMANAVINPDAQIGKQCIVNTGAIVEHDNIIATMCMCLQMQHFAGQYQ